MEQGPQSFESTPVRFKRKLINILIQRDIAKRIIKKGERRPLHDDLNKDHRALLIYYVDDHSVCDIGD